MIDKAASNFLSVIDVFFFASSSRTERNLLLLPWNTLGNDEVSNPPWHAALISLPLKCKYPGLRLPLTAKRIPLTGKRVQSDFAAKMSLWTLRD